MLVIKCSLEKHTIFSQCLLWKVQSVFFLANKLKLHLKKVLERLCSKIKSAFHAFVQMRISERCRLDEAVAHITAAFVPSEGNPLCIPAAHLFPAWQHLS